MFFWVKDWRPARRKPGDQLDARGPPVAGQRDSFHRRRRRRSGRRAACPGAGNSGQAGRGAAHLRERSHQAGRRLGRRDPKSMSGAVYDRWYCTPYPQSIALQLTEAIPHSHAEQIRQVAQNEGAVLTRIEGLIFLITLAALFASALAVSAAMATTIFERRAEVGLMKALGAGKIAVASIFFAEALLLALMGGAVGFAGAGCWPARSGSPSSTRRFLFIRCCCR